MECSPALHRVHVVVCLHRPLPIVVFGNPDPVPISVNIGNSFIDLVTAAACSTTGCEGPSRLVKAIFYLVVFSIVGWGWIRKHKNRVRTIITIKMRSSSYIQNNSANAAAAIYNSRSMSQLTNLYRYIDQSEMSMEYAILLCSYVDRRSAGNIYFTIFSLSFLTAGL